MSYRSKSFGEPTPQSFGIYAWITTLLKRLPLKIDREADPSTAFFPMISGPR
jgi:hypothetical protein